MKLAEIYDKHKAENKCSDKGTRHNYIESYEWLFAPFQNEHITLLEIGVKRGYSLQLWREYFTNATILGIDIKPMVSEISGCQIHVCDQTDSIKTGDF